MPLPRKLRHYQFTHDVSVISNKTLPVVIFKKGYSKLTTEATKNIIKGTSIQNKNVIKAWAKASHCKSAVKTQPQDKQRWNNTRYVHDHQCNRVMYGHTRLHDLIRNKIGNTRWWAPRYSVRVCTSQLVINKGRGKEEAAVIMVIQRWHWKHWWNHHER